MISKLRAWPVIAALALVAAMLVAAGCGDDDGGGGGGGGLNTITEGELRVGSDIPYPPFEFGRAPDYDGFDVDMVNEIAKRLDLEARFVKTPFDPIFRNLAQGRFDMVASATTITPERERTVDFSEPYFPADQSLMIKRGSDIRTVDDLAGKTIGAQLGTTGADYAKDETDAETVRTYDLIDDAFKALQAGQIEAVINDFPVSKYAERSKQDLQVVDTIETDENYGFGFAKESTALRDRVNEALKDMKDDDTYTEIYRKWFEQDPPDRVFEVSGAEGT
ncbi:MAG: basic amino acid ABC transporter substrate-binding protein [Solirubrobacterales bacterium]